MPDELRSYTTIEVARRLGVSLQTVQRWVDAGHLKAWKTPGGHRRVDAASAEHLIETRRQSLGAAPAPPAGAEPAWAGLSAVVVDDDPIDRELLVRLVRKALPGAIVEMAANGFEALVIVARRAPSLLVADIHMPHMDGFEMIRHLLADDAIRPRMLVAVSAHTADDLASFGELPGTVLFLSKPVDEARFIDAVSAALRPVQGTPSPRP